MCLLNHELADPNQVLLILPLVKKGFSFPYGEAITRIIKALENEPVVEVNPIGRITGSKRTTPFSGLALTMEEMDGKEEVLISLEDAEGEVSAGMVTPYPPGIPLLVPGERITADVIRRLKEYIENKANIQGHHRLADHCVYVYR